MTTPNLCLKLEHYLNNHIFNWSPNSDWHALRLPKGTIEGTLSSFLSSYLVSYVSSTTPHASGIRAVKIVLGAKILETAGCMAMQLLQDKIYRKTGTSLSPLDLQGRYWVFIPSTLISLGVGKFFGTRFVSSYMTTLIALFVLAYYGKHTFHMGIVVR